LRFQYHNGNLVVFHGDRHFLFHNQEQQVVLVRHGTSVHNTWKDFPARRNGDGIVVGPANQNFPDVTDANRSDAPLTAFFKMEGITRFGATKWDILGHNAGNGLEQYITHNVRIHVSPHTRTLQTMILALYDIPHIQHATIVVDPRIREVRKGIAVDCVGNDHIHMIAQINAQFAELATWHENDHQGITGIRNAINAEFQASLVAAVNAAHTAGTIKIASGLFKTNWFGALETEYGRGAYFAGRYGMWPEIGTYPERRVILFGHSAMFRAILNNMPGYSQVPEYFKTDKMINYGHVLINYAAGHGFVPETRAQYGNFKVAHRLQVMLQTAAANGQNNNAIVADVGRIASNQDPLDARLRAYKTGGLIKSGQATSVFNMCQ
jgi:hypothetical protein